MGHRTVLVAAEDSCGGRGAHLGPARPAVVASRASGVVVDHDLVADGGDVGGDGWPHGVLDASGLMSAQALVRGRDLTWSITVVVQVAAAGAGCPDGDHHFARPRLRVGKVPKFDLAVTRESCPLHVNCLQG
jgi:hypothetical protein